MLISKKDLLKETGISYGQLYRWKREGLIPEEWFIKQSSYTGQETFFPKTQMLNRIRAIQRLKDQYSLEELAKMLSPEISERVFSERDLAIIEEIDDRLIKIFFKVFKKRIFSFIEVLFLTALSIFYIKHNLKIVDVENLCLGMKDYLEDIKQTDYLCLLLKFDATFFAVIQDEKSPVYIDQRIQTVDKIRLNDISSRMKIKYRKSFNFEFDEEFDEVKDSKKHLIDQSSDGEV
ncbi:MAG: DUF4004 family protein [Firmicutes bacterium]|nr:DUF4004 family protein [Bacillota bacterium]MDD4694402.1 DUF4004 family protein [Bacillota bacterium]